MNSREKDLSSLFNSRFVTRVIFVKVASRVAFSVLYAGIRGIYNSGRQLRVADWRNSNGRLVRLDNTSFSLSFFFSHPSVLLSRGVASLPLFLSASSNRTGTGTEGLQLRSDDRRVRVRCAHRWVFARNVRCLFDSHYRLSSMNRNNNEAEALDRKTRVSNVHEDSWGKRIFHELYMYTVISICRSIR